MLPNPAAQPTISVDLAGEILGISRSSAYQAARTGEIPTIRIGRRLVVPTAALLRLLDLEQPSPCPTENVRAALAALDADALADLIGAVHAFRDDLRQDPLDGAWVATSATVDGIDAALAALDGTP